MPFDFAVVAFQADHDLVADHGREVFEEGRRAGGGRNLFPVKFGVDAVARLLADFLRCLAGIGRADIGKRADAHLFCFLAH
jgi:hypothetical protein